MNTRTAAAIVVVLTLAAVANELPDALRCPLLMLFVVAGVVAVAILETKNTPAE